jgi:hypothetical protein
MSYVVTWIEEETGNTRDELLQETAPIKAKGLSVCYVELFGDSCKHLPSIKGDQSSSTHREQFDEIFAFNLLQHICFCESLDGQQSAYHAILNAMPLIEHVPSQMPGTSVPKLLGY